MSTHTGEKDPVTPVQVAWSKGLASEVSFWKDWIDSKGSRWPNDFRTRMDANAPLQDHLRALINVPENATIRILDVGAGPLTRLGKAWNGRKIEIIAVDPLADEYNAAIDAAGVTPLVRTQKGDGEHLSELFPGAFFDLAYAVNCLDHAYDAVAAIRQMLLVTRPGAFVQLDHAVNEAEKQKYRGLHQWNFCIEDQRFICWRPDVRIDVGQALAGLIDETRVRPAENWVSVGFRRRLDSAG